MIKTNSILREKIQQDFRSFNLWLEFNPRHGLVKSLYSLQKKDPELAEMVAHQVKKNKF